MKDIWQTTTLAGVLCQRVTVGSDARGSGRRVTDSGGLREARATFVATDAFVLTSRPGVLRGMHVRERGAKLITCLSGVVHEVVLDLRPGSPTFGRYEVFELSECSSLNLFIPPGVANGFLTLGFIDSQVLIQSDLSEGPSAETGVRWNSFGFVWPKANPVISERDAGAPVFESGGF